ncbi:MAG: alpha/beta hydrolase [Anaerolineae bacterium]|jgi:pimeloyl-ACP methyl ester carboxylesterase|nr:alpha/beta hydrolase [Anaerolineae bacterium]
MDAMQILNVAEHKLAALSFNPSESNIPLVFIHGITSSPAFWVHGQNELIKGLRWYALSLPGHYPAAFPNRFTASELTAPLIADLCEEALKQLIGDQPAIVIGHSTGGFAALMIATRYPQRVKAVVSISGFAHGRWIGALGLFQRLARMGPIGQGLFRLGMKLTTSSRSIYRAALRSYAYNTQALYRDPALEPTLDAIYPMSQQLHLDSMLAYFQQMPHIDITESLTAITMPTLIIVGDHDPIVPPEQSRLIHQQIKGSVLHMLKNTGHVPMSESSAEYNQVLTAWLKTQL